MGTQISGQSMGAQERGKDRETAEKCEQICQRKVQTCADTVLPGTRASERGLIIHPPLNCAALLRHKKDIKTYLA